MATKIHIGDVVRCAGVFKNSAGSAIDPSGQIKFKFKTPAGVTTTYTYGTDAQLVRDSTGNYHVDIDITESGNWYYRFESTGTGKASDEQYFKVVRTNF